MKLGQKSKYGQNNNVKNTVGQLTLPLGLPLAQNIIKWKSIRQAINYFV
jgi:hypothetical protein